MLFLIVFIRSFRARIGQLWHGEQEPQTAHDTEQALWMAQRLVRMRSDPGDPTFTVNADRITIESDRCYEFAREPDGWLQVPTDDDVAAIEEQLCTRYWIDDRFLRTIQYHPDVAWDLEAVEQAAMSAATKIARGTSRVLHALH